MFSWSTSESHVQNHKFRQIILQISFLVQSQVLSSNLLLIHSPSNPKPLVSLNFEENFEETGAGLQDERVNEISRVAFSTDSKGLKSHKTISNAFLVSNFISEQFSSGSGSNYIFPCDSFTQKRETNQHLHSWKPMDFNFSLRMELNGGEEKPGNLTLKLKNWTFFSVPL